MSPRLVGFAGPAGVGKSTAAALVAGEGGWRMVSFADPLRAMALAFHPEWTLLDAVGPHKDRVVPASPWRWTLVEDALIQRTLALTGLSCLDKAHWDAVLGTLSVLQHALSPRQTLRALGDMVKAIDPDAFVRSVRMRAGDAAAQGLSVVIDDVRFESEATLVRELGGLVVHLQREGSAFRRDHNSEQGVAVVEADVIALNRGSVQMLRGELYHALGLAGRRVREVAA